VHQVRVSATDLPGVLVVETPSFADLRGTFTRWFCERELAAVLGNRHIVQVNHSCTKSVGAIRGLHYQLPPHAEMKLVRCLRGRVWDVVVDLRYGSPTLLRWYAEELSSDNPRMVVVPEGCAHGFQVLEEASELLYLHTAFFEAGAEAGARYDDPRIGICWPLPPSEVSDRDRRHPPVDPLFAGVIL
jgi:dTDP-4-dehydrorhamnose 3,5-epimerase